MDNVIKANPHHYQVWDVSMPVPSAQNIVGQFHTKEAAKDYAIQLSAQGGCVLAIRKGEYAR
jgi:uncharacterized protein YbdZ (MbtH family)